MDRSEIPSMLRKLANSMESVATEMHRHADLDTCYGYHGRELQGAATITRSWAEKIERLEMEKISKSVAEGRQS